MDHGYCVGHFPQLIINSQEIPDGEVITIIIALKREKDGRLQSGEVKRMVIIS